MTLSDDDRLALAELDSRLKTVLPEKYQDAYEEVRPDPMGSAGLKFADDGTVAWDEIWGSFCDLAMAGGPPHKGALLEPGSPSEIDARRDQYKEVLEEVCRGVEMVTGMPCEESPVPGWVRVECYSETMAAWLLRAIVMENVAARAEGALLDLPVAPGFRLEKEIKNVITVIAKTSHYWLEHMPRMQQRAIAALFAMLARESPLIETPLFAVESLPAAQPPLPTARPGDDALAVNLSRMTGLPASASKSAGWLGLECPHERAAVWMMRALVVLNVLSRREGRVLFLPANPISDPNGARMSAAVTRIHRLAVSRGAL